DYYCYSTDSTDTHGLF
nr:immunoglobulin light chain junction region [Macaca mulatta]